MFRWAPPFDWSWLQGFIEMDGIDLASNDPWKNPWIMSGGIIPPESPKDPSEMIHCQKNP